MARASVRIIHMGVMVSAVTRSVSFSAAALVLLTVALFWHPWRPVRSAKPRPDSLSPDAFLTAGTVRSLFGRPIAGAPISAHKLDAAGSRTSEQPASTSTDAHGVYHLVLGASDYIIEASHAEFATGSAYLVVDGSKARDLDLTLVPAASISGQVLDLPTGKGVSGATVTASGELEMGSVTAGRAPPTAVTRADGSFTLRGLRPGTIRLAASRKDLATRDPTIVLLLVGDELLSVEVWVDVAFAVSGSVTSRRDGSGPGEPLVAEGSISGSVAGACDGIVTGSVMDTQGMRARGVWVAANREDPARSPAEPRASVVGSVVTSDDGQFALEGLCQGSYWVSAYSLATTGRAAKAHVHAGDRVSLALGKPSILRGSVWYAGKPVTDYVCILTGPVSRRERIEDGDGNYRLPWLDPGHYELTVEASEGHSVRSIELLPNTVEQLKIVLSPWSAGSNLQAP